MVEDVISKFRDHRLSTYLSLSAQPFSKNFTISNTTYYQPVLNNFTDVRLSSQTSMEFIISKKLTFTSIFSITNDTYSLRNGIRFSF